MGREAWVFTVLMGCASSKPKEPLPVEPAGKDEPVGAEQVELDVQKEDAKPEMQRGGTKRRVAVSAQASSAAKDTGGGASRSVVEKTEEQTQQILDATETNMLFAGLNQEQLKEIVACMFQMECTPGQVVIQQGDVGDNFYVVASGEYQVFLQKKGNTPVHTYQSGTAFGELALMYNCPRAATIKCSVAGKLWGLDQGTFRDIMMSQNKSQMSTHAKFLKSVSILSPLSDEQRDALSSNLEQVSYEDGQAIVKQGDPADALYFIKTGKVHVLIKTDSEEEGLGHKVAELKSGDFFGENAVSGEAKPTRAASIVAEGDVDMLKLTSEDFAETIGDLAEALKYNFNQKVLGGMAMFKVLSEGERQILTDALKETRFAKDTEIIKQGEEGKSFYIIKSGSVKVTRGRETIKDKLTVGEYFGEMAIMKGEPRMATVTALVDTTCMELDRETFNSILGPLNDIMSRDAERRLKEAESMKRPEVLYSDLRVHNVLGVGTFGRVKLVVHTPTDTPYALKCMRKGQIIALKQVEHVMNEKKILAMCDHPFLLRLAGAYQDSDEIYMLLELALGGELFTILRERVMFDEPVARFYAANVCAAFEYLHDRKIVYRDLKPENLLLDSDGYLKVVDFGFAKIISERTWTLCGTPEYLAPEIISNKGHNLSVDWWALGILIFEMLHGTPPFVADDPMDIYQQASAPARRARRRPRRRRLRLRSDPPREDLVAVDHLEDRPRDGVEAARRQPGRPARQPQARYAGSARDEFL